MRPLLRDLRGQVALLASDHVAGVDCHRLSRGLSGKVLEVPVRRIFTGGVDAVSRDLLLSAAALSWVVELWRERAV